MDKLSMPRHCIASFSLHSSFLTSALKESLATSLESRQKPCDRIRLLNILAVFRTFIWFFAEHSKVDLTTHFCDSAMSLQITLRKVSNHCLCAFYTCKYARMKYIAFIFFVGILLIFQNIAYFFALC